MAGRLIVLLLASAVATAVHAGGSGPIQVAPDGATVWVANPDSDTVAAIDTTTDTRVGEYGVGRHPRTVAVTTRFVYVANQGEDSVTRLDRDGSNPRTVPLPVPCAPYAVATSADEARVYVSCQATSQLLLLDADLGSVGGVVLGWPEARAIAVADDGKVYVTHFITKEPNHEGHVSEIDPVAGSVTRVLAIPPDFTSCETLGGGQGVANLLSAIAVAPAGAAAGQIWVGGTLHNSLRKGLFERSRYFQDQPGIGLFPDITFQSNPAGADGAGRRDIYRAARHDIARGVVWQLDRASGSVTGKLDVAGGGQVAGIAFSADGGTVHLVDLLANGYYVLRSERGHGGNPAGVFGPVSASGPGGANPGGACSGNADDVVPEAPYVLPPEARLVPTGGMEPLDAATHLAVATGLEFTVATGLMRGVSDGVGTTPIGLALSPDGHVAYVANYLARNVAVVGADGSGATGFRCQGAPDTACRSRGDCPGAAECMPLVRAVIPSTAVDPLAPEILDGKILFSTSARDAGGANGPVPPWNVLPHDGSVHQGEVTSIARDGASLACASCHPDFGGNDGRTWDFSQFSASLRNTMDLRGRASFVPGTCSHDPTVSCTTDSACGPTATGRQCRNNPSFIPPNILPADRPNYFNPIGSAHWNGDRDEVEDFEFTLRELMGASDCDGAEEKPETCVGALVVRRFVADPTDARADLGQPNRNRSPRLNHLADYVYSLTEFPRNPNFAADGSPSDAARRGRLIFNDPIVRCSFCHNGASAQHQLFTDKIPNPGYDPTQTPRADLNSPFLRFDVGTANVFDRTNPFLIANDANSLRGFTLFQNEQVPIPGNRANLTEYITPLLTDAWNTAPYLHDGSAPTLLDVVRPCSSKLESCTDARKGRNIDDQHGTTSFLSARQMNDLAAYEQAPHGPVEERRGVSAALLEIKVLRARFAKGHGKDRLDVQGRASLRAEQVLDPAHEPVILSIGVPAGERMAIFERSIPPAAFRGNRAQTRFRLVDRRAAPGVRALVLRIRGGTVTVQLGIARADLTALHVRDPDYTVGLEIGDETVAGTRRFRTNKRGNVTKGPVNQTPKKRGK